MAQPPKQPCFQKLYALAKSGDAVAAGQLLKKYEETVTSFLERRVGPGIRRRFELSDLYQKTAMEALRQLSRWPDEISAEDFASYICRIAHWQVLDAARAKPRELGESAVASFDRPEPVPTTGVVTRQDERDRLKELIGRMRETYASVLTLCVLEGRSTKEAADELGLSEEAVRQRPHRARAELVARIAERQVGDKPS